MEFDYNGSNCTSSHLWFCIFQLYRVEFDGAWNTKYDQKTTICYTSLQPIIWMFTRQLWGHITHVWKGGGVMPLTPLTSPSRSLYPSSLFLFSLIPNFLHSAHPPTLIPSPTLSYTSFSQLKVDLRRLWLHKITSVHCYLLKDFRSSEQ